MRIILDTNVLVSALLKRSYPFFIVDRILADVNLNLCLSSNLLAEYFEVLARDKFTKFKDFQSSAQKLLIDLEQTALIFKPTIKVDLIADDADNRLLELALTCDANFLITGNTKDFTIRVSQYKDHFA